jgi:hypothetical protein
MMGHNVSSCSKFFTKPKCGKCGGGYTTKNRGVKCSYCFGLGHTEECCWNKNGRSPLTTVNYLKVLINDKEATLSKLNRLCGINNNVFSGTRVSRH